MLQVQRRKVNSREVQRICVAIISVFYQIILLLNQMTCER
jgi:hypothetical protein